MGETKFKKQCHLQQIQKCETPRDKYNTTYKARALRAAPVAQRNERNAKNEWRAVAGSQTENSVCFRNQVGPNGSILSVQHSSRSYSMFFLEIEKLVLNFIEEYKKILS